MEAAEILRSSSSALMEPEHKDDAVDEGPQLALAYRAWDPVEWEAKLADPVFVDDSRESVVPMREAQTKFYHEALKSKYHLLEWRGIKPLDIFLKEAIYSAQDQENILRLWLGYGENVDSLRRGEELFFFLDEEDLGTATFEKFVSFHMTVADQNHYGEINFAEFVRMYQLLAVSYQARDSLLGALICHRGDRDRDRVDDTHELPSSSSANANTTDPLAASMELPVPPPKSAPTEASEAAWRAKRADIIARLEYCTYEEGELVFRQDEPLTHVIFLFSGRVQTFRTTRDKQRQVNGTIGSGAYVGTIEYIARRPTLRSGVALQRCYVVKLPVDGFEQVLEHEDSLVWSMVSTTLMNIRNIQTFLQSEALALRARPNNNNNNTNANASTSSSSSLATPTLVPSTSSPSLLVPPNTAATSAQPPSSSSPLTAQPTSSSSSSDSVTSVPRSSLGGGSGSSDAMARTAAVLSQTFEGNALLVQALLERLAQGKCQRLRLKTGEFLFRRGAESTAIFVLLSGEASRILSQVNNKEVHLYPSYLIGDFALLSGQDQPNDVRCLTRCSFLVIPKAVVMELTKERRLVLLDFIRPMIASICAHLLELEYPYEYFFLRNGEHLIRPGDAPDCFYFLLNGRLREQRVDAHGALVVVREHANPGTTIGISRLLLGTPHTTFTTAVRDTELVRFDKTWITQLMRANPSGMQALIKTSLMHDDMAAQQKIPSGQSTSQPSHLRSLAMPSQQLHHQGPHDHHHHHLHEEQPHQGQQQHHHHHQDSAAGAQGMEKSAPKRLVAVVPLSADVPVQGFTLNLGKVLRQMAAQSGGGSGGVKVVTEELILRRFGKIRNVALQATERSNLWYYISEMEKKHDYVLAIAKPSLSPWTRWILQQVDTVILLAHEGLDLSRLAEWETTLDFYNSVYYMAEKRLVVMHRPGSTISATSAVLQRRRRGIGAVQFHHHLVEGNRFHYQSLARFLSGSAVGLVLGGGGARGLAHVGAVLALREAGVPVDIVGGTSMGAQVGGLLAAEMPVQDIALAMRQAYLWATGATRFVDVTFPYLSLLSGKLWTQRMRRWIGLDDRRVEDLPVPFFCVSCNLSKLCEHIHSEGLLWQSARASSSMPLLFPPFVTDEGDALIDGGYVNNVPADIMKKRYGANYVIAVDVYDSSKITNMKGLYDDAVSGWRVLFDTLWMRRKYASMHELLMQLGGIVDHSNSPKRARYIDMLVRPDLPETKDFRESWHDFVNSDRLILLGYQQTKDQLELLRREKPDVFSAISRKVDYPKEQSTYRFDAPTNFPQRTWLESVMLIFFSRKFLLVAIVSGGVYKYVATILGFILSLLRGGTVRKRLSSLWRLVTSLRSKYF